MHINIWVITTLLYALALIGLRFKPEKAFTLFLGGLAWMVHGIMLSTFLSTPLPFLNLWVVTSLLLWMALPMTYFLSRPLASTRKLMTPVATLTLLTLFAYPWLGQIPPWTHSNLSLIDTLHIIAALTATVILGVACLVAYVMRVRDEAIKHNPSLMLSKGSPPLEKIEHVFIGIVFIGFISLSTSIGLGFIHLENILVQKQAHKLFFTLIAWTIYLTMLIGHFKYGWRGKRLLFLSIIAFACLILGYMGSKFVLEWLTFGGLS